MPSSTPPPTIHWYPILLISFSVGCPSRSHMATSPPPFDTFFTPSFLLSVLSLLVPSPLFPFHRRIRLTGFYSLHFSKATPSDSSLPPVRDFSIRVAPICLFFTRTAEGFTSALFSLLLAFADPFSPFFSFYIRYLAFLLFLAQPSSSCPLSSKRFLFF